MPSNIGSTEINRLCPYIVPRGWPGARSYLRVENIYVKLSYTENSIAGIAGNNICSENFLQGSGWGDYEYTNGGHEKFRVHTCLFKDCIYDYNGHEYASESMKNTKYTLHWDRIWNSGAT